METVEVVIRIPKEYKDYIEGGAGIIPDKIIQYLFNALDNGTVLPKGHGDLKDIHDIINRINLNYNNHQSIDAYSLKDMIITVPTIIEADREVEHDSKD